MRTLTTAVCLLLAVTTALAADVEYEGIIKPNMVIELGSPAEGVVDKVAVQRSQLVKKGQTLVDLESSVQRASVKKAAAMAEFEGDISLQKTQLAFAKRVQKRVKGLNSINAHDKDQAATNVTLTGFKLLKAQEEKKLANLELAKVNAMLKLRTIKSPISGVVVERYVSPGEYISSQPLMQIAQIDPLRVEVIVPASMFGKISPQMKATVVPELAGYGEQTATVQLVDKVIDPASNTFGVSLKLPNPGNKLPSGLRCLVRFELNETADE